MDKNFIEIGKVVNTHGIRGDLKIIPWCDDPAVFCDLEDIYIDGKRYEIENARLHKTAVLLKANGVDSINDAELLKNKTVYVERDALGELPEGTYYICDLLGLEVKTEEGEVLGVIDDIIKTGSNDVYVLKDKTGKRKNPILIPVIDEVVREVNIEAGYVTVKLLKGLID